MRKILRSSLVCAYAALVLAIAACGIGRVEAGERQKPLADLPMTLIGDRVAVIQVNIGARRDLNFIVDTGASDEILDAALAKELAITVDKPTMVPQPGGAVPIGRTAGVEIVLGSLVLKSWPFVTAPLRSLEAFLGMSFDGIFGQALFERYVVEFDYANHRLRLYDPATFTYTGSGSVLALERPDGRLFIRAQLEGTGQATADGLLQLDTGSFEALGLDGPDVERLKLVASDAPRAPLFGLALGGETSGYRTRLKGVVFGPYRIDGPITSVTTSSNAGNDPVSFGVVGGDILRRFKVILLASRHQIILEPTASLHESFRWDANGLILMSPRPFTGVLVYKVLEGSSGAAAGLRPGDELIELDGKAVGALGQDNVWRALQAPYRRHVLKIRRGAEDLSVSLLTKPIMH